MADLEVLDAATEEKEIPSEPLAEDAQNVKSEDLQTVGGEQMEFEVEELPEETAQEALSKEDKKLLKREQKQAAKQAKKEQQSYIKKKRHPIRNSILILLLVGVVVLGYIGVNQMMQPVPVDTFFLERQDLSSTVALTGVVESADMKKVYPKSSGRISQMNVEVGDTVVAGMVLAQLDTADVQLSLAERQAAIEYNQIINGRNLELAEKNLTTTKEDVNAGLNADLVRARQEVDRTQQLLNTARNDYNDARDDRTDADELLTFTEKQEDRAKTAYLAAEKEKDRLAKVYSDIKRDFEDGVSGVLQTDVDDAKQEATDAYTAWVDAENAYKAAVAARQAAAGDSTELSRERQNYRTARVNYENAVEALTLAENAVKRQMEGYEDTIATTELGIDEKSNAIQLQKLQKQLSDAVVYAPISGTVTEVYIEEGEPASSATPMFIIEDTENLVIKTKIKEYDVTSVQTGMKAVIKSDATGEEAFEGEVSWIDPVAIKNADGSVKKDGTIEFNTDVELLSPNTDLRVGMNVRLNVVLDEIYDVYAVPFDAVLEDSVTQESYIMVVKKGYDEKRKVDEYIVEKVVVETGLETDFYVQISSSKISQGDIVISDPSEIEEGASIALTEKALAGYTPSNSIPLKNEDSADKDALLEELLEEDQTTSGDDAQPEPVVLQTIPQPVTEQPVVEESSQETVPEPEQTPEEQSGDQTEAAADDAAQVTDDAASPAA